MMKIIVCLKMVVDVKVPLEITSGRLSKEGLVYDINPADLQALENALAIKETFQSKVIVISLGPEPVEEGLRQCLALGADQAIRLWDPAFEGSDPCIKALILTRAIQLTGFDLILLGARSKDTARGIVGPTMAAILKLPQVTSVTSLDFSANGKTFTAYKKAPKGSREKIYCHLPILVTMGREMERLRYATWLERLQSIDKEIIEWGLSTLELSPQQVGRAASPTTTLGLTYPCPRTIELPLPDPNLPYHARIQQLLSDSLTKRGGKVVVGKIEEMIEDILQALKQKGF